MPARMLTALPPASIVLTCVTLSACAPPAISRGDFDAPDPASRTYAIERAVQQQDLAALPSIVEALDSDDPAVRFVAIGALHRLTGETHGYEYDAEPAARREAIVRWNAALASEATDADASGVPMSPGGSTMHGGDHG